MKPPNIRALACETLVLLFEKGRPLVPHQDPNLSAQDNAFISECCFGVTRFYKKLCHSANRLLSKPLAKRDHRLYLLLLLGIYQLEYMRLPEHAALFETVAAAKHLKRPYAKALLNGCLRQHLRTRKEFTPLPLLKSSPAWFVKSLEKAFGKLATDILALHETPAPMTLRIDTHRSSREAYLEQLAKQQLTGTLHSVSTALVLDKPCSVHILPGFEEGLVSVQDASSQLAAHFLNPEPEDTVLDACAAPGSKTGHLWQHAKGNVRLVSVDNSTARVQKLSHTLTRLGIAATVHTLPAEALGKHYPDATFDKILLDAPCSGTGVIRRHPDILVLRTPAHIHALLQTQQTLLRALWPLLKPGGALLYVTCSVLTEENDVQIAAFLKETPDAMAKPLFFEQGIPQQHGLQILPQKDMDGFYFAYLTRSSQSSTDPLYS